MTTLKDYKRKVIELSVLSKNAFLKEKSDILALELKLVAEVETIIENELKDFSENYSFETSDHVVTNCENGVNFIKETTDIDIKLDRYPDRITDEAKERFKNNFSGQFDYENHIYSMIEFDQSFYKDHNLIIDGKCHKVFNQLHAQLLNEFYACKNGEIKDIYKLGYYDDVNKFEAIKLDESLTAFQDDDKMTMNRLDQICTCFDLFNKCTDENIYLSDLANCFNDEVIKENEYDVEIELDCIELKGKILTISYTKESTVKRIIKKIDITKEL